MISNAHLDFISLEGSRQEESQKIFENGNEKYEDIGWSEFGREGLWEIWESKTRDLAQMSFWMTLRDTDKQEKGFVDVLLCVINGILLLCYNTEGFFLKISETQTQTDLTEKSMNRYLQV